MPGKTGTEAKAKAAAGANVRRCLGGDGRIALSLPCRKCRYNLRLHVLDEACPECGTPVAETLTDDLFIFSDARWQASAGEAD
jgi:hypothetical protein